MANLKCPSAKIYSGFSFWQLPVSILSKTELGNDNPLAIATIQIRRPTQKR